MSPFGNGRQHNPERRRKDTAIPGGKREDDPDIELAERFGVWAKLLVTHRAKLWAFGMMLSVVGGWLIASAMLGPRVTRLEQSVSSLQHDVDVLKRSEETKMYILCTLIRRVDPNAEPGECRSRLALLTFLQVAHLSPLTKL